MYSELKNLDLSLLGGPRLAEVGKIKIGGKGKKVTSKKGTQFRVPEKYDHFVITTNFKDPRTDDFVPDITLMKQIGQQTGQDPANLRSIPVTLLFDDPDLNFYARFSCYRGNQAWCMGDGSRAFRLVNKSGERKEVQCPCERVVPGYEGDKCKVFGRLSVIIGGVERIGGVWVFRTTSWNSVRNILSSMMLIKQITGGVLAGLPLVLGIQPKTVMLPTGQSQTVYVVSLEFTGSLEKLNQKALGIRRQRAEYKVQIETLEEQIRRRLLALPEEAGDEDRDIQEEFYPENVAETREENTKGELGPEEAAKTQSVSPETEDADQGDPAETEPQTQEAEEWEEAAEFEEIDPESSQEGPPQTATLWD